MGGALVSIHRAMPRNEALGFAEPVSWDILKGEHWAVVGRNGSGKNLLADILQGRYSLREGAVSHTFKRRTYESIKSISFNDIHSIADTRNSYYQQRWHATETDDLPTVGELLSGIRLKGDYGKLFDLFGVRKHLKSKIVHLSSGELRKFLILRTVLSNPDILIIDNPFIGLDAPSRLTLTELLNEIAESKRFGIVLLTPNPTDIPTVITNVMPVDGMLHNAHTISAKEPTDLPTDNGRTSEHNITFRMDNVTVSYGGRTILDSVNWEVRNGEKWALLGRNGSGKTLLLSMIYADNPQAYAQKITIFDRQRGSGESIWDIKRRIGYVSPEMHLYYRENVATKTVVSSGFFDTTGLYRKCSPQQATIAAKWMQIFGIEHLAERQFLTLSSGEQRLALLARAFVKDPDLLILDEPLHGLDPDNKQLTTRIIETFCRRAGKSLVYVTHYPDELPACVDRRFSIGDIE